LQQNCLNKIKINNERSQAIAFESIRELHLVTAFGAQGLGYQRLE